MGEWPRAAEADFPRQTLENAHLMDHTVGNNARIQSPESDELLSSWYKICQWFFDSNTYKNWAGEKPTSSLFW